MRCLLSVVVLSASLTFVGGCSLGEPTYMDISPMQLEEIASRIGTTTEMLYREDRALLKTEIAEAIGMKVDAIHIPDVPAGTSPAEIVAAIRSEGLTVQIEPATTAALGELAEGGLVNPVDKEGWITGGLAGAGVLLAGALGLRGRSVRRRKEAA